MAGKKRVVLGNLGGDAYGLRVSKSTDDAINPTTGAQADISALLFDSINPISHLPIYKIVDVTCPGGSYVAGTSNKRINPGTKSYNFGETLASPPLAFAYENTGTNTYISENFGIYGSVDGGFDFSSAGATERGFYYEITNSSLTVYNYSIASKTVRIFLLYAPATNVETVGVRVSRSIGSSTLANNASQNLELYSTSSSYALLKLKVEVNNPTMTNIAWLRVYTDEASRTADASRTTQEEAGVNSGVVAEIITSGDADSEEILIAPALVGYNQDSGIKCRITNLSGSSAAFTITATYVTLED